MKGAHFHFPLLWDLPLQWRHNENDGVSNHQPHICLLNRLFGLRSKKTSKLRITGLYAGNSPGTGEFPAQMASNAENITIWWCNLAMRVYPIKYIHRFCCVLFCWCQTTSSLKSSVIYLIFPRSKWINSLYWSDGIIDNFLTIQLTLQVNERYHCKTNIMTFLHAKPWIPGGEKSIYTVVIH